MAFPESAPKYNHYGDVTFIRGGVLDRFSIDLDVSKRLRKGHYWFWVFEPTPHMFEIQCDHCKKRHSPKNIECSATLGLMSSFKNPNVLYSRVEEYDNVSPISLSMVEYDGKINGCVVHLSPDNIYARSNK